MATQNSLTLTMLAQQAAAQRGFTARRWWRDANDPDVLQSMESRGESSLTISW